MAKKIPGATQSAASQRIQRTEAYAGTVKRMFDETVNDILKLKLAKPTEEGVMYSFDGDTIQVRKRVEELLKRLHSSATLAVKKGIQAEWGIANKEMDDLVKATFGKKLFESDRFRAWTGHNEAAMNAFVNRTDKGMNLSDRVWQASRQLRDEMEVALTVGMGSGESAASMSRAVRQCLNDPDLMFRRFRYKKGEDENGNPIYGKKWKKKVIVDGKTKWIDYDKDSYIPKGAGGHSRGVYKSAAKNAMRVARTETNMAYRRADYERWQKMDFVLGIRIELSNQHPIPDICDDMQGDYPKTFYFSGFHPHCYSDDTRVLTDEGWKLFSDVRGDELILSLNPETRETEWVSIIDRQKYEKKGDMIRFSCEDLDILVTPEHSMVYKDKSGEIKRCNASDFDWGKGDIMNMDMSYGFFEKEIVPYDGYVYDLSLDRNHIMYVARKGKCFWGSNCFCYATPILVSEDEMAKVTEEFMEGRTYVPKGEPIVDTPPAFKQWVADNSDRIRNASSLPYWIKDNPQFVDARKGVALTPDPKTIKAEIAKEGVAATVAKDEWEALGISKGSPMSWAEANSGHENPNYEPHTQFHYNCQTCTVVHEMRRRGYNITAKGSNDGFAKLEAEGFDWQRRYLNQDGSDVKPYWSWQWRDDKGYINMTRQSLDEYFKEQLKADGRYEVYCAWSQKTSHVFCIEKRGDTIRWFDPQTGKSGAVIEAYKEKMVSNLVYVMRIDDKKINPEMARCFETGKGAATSQRKGIKLKGSDAPTGNKEAALFYKVANAESNKEKVTLLKDFIEDKGNNFKKLGRFSTKDHSIYSGYDSQFDEALKKGEMPKNLDMARKLLKHGYDVYLMPNPSESSSFDFIVKDKNGKLYSIEGKAFNGENTLDHLIDKGSKQATRVVIDVIGNDNTKYIEDRVTEGFKDNASLEELWLLKGSRLIKVTRQAAESKRFSERFARQWKSKK